MIITNKFNLPQSIVNTVTYNKEKNEARLSVTDLIGSPLQRQLKLKHWDELQSDVSDMMWMLLGQSVHYILEKGAPKSSLSEQKIEMQFGDFTIIGIPDLYHDGIISDWKITSVYSFILGDKPEWEAQLNCYAFLLRHCGFDVKSLKINAILRDHQKSKSLASADYPSIPFQQVDIPLWNTVKTEMYISDRVALHSKPATECTDEEKWKRPTKYAVMKKNQKRAVRVFETQEEADKLIETNKDYILEIRQGACVKCESYCSVNNWCEYYKPTTIEE